MKKYDLTVLVKEVAGVEEKMEKVAKALGGKVGRMVEMGKKQLAYEINGNNAANFLTWALELPAAAVVQLERKLTLDKDIVRHLLVKLDK
jgi:small subunit ribosomal protein S6